MLHNKPNVMKKLCFDLFKGSLQLIKGAWKISHLDQPIVTIFGGSRLSQKSIYAKKAHELAHKLIEEDISIITGGGPGIMQSASCAIDKQQRKKMKAKSIAITVKGLQLDQASKVCSQEYLVMDYFFARKWLMINYAVAFAVFPGGFGTLDELAQVLTLMQTKKLQHMPIVLIGIDYWQPLMTWIKTSALKNHLVIKEDVDLICQTDDIDEALSLLKEWCKP